MRSQIASTASQHGREVYRHINHGVTNTNGFNSRSLWKEKKNVITLHNVGGCANCVRLECDLGAINVSTNNTNKFQVT